MLTKPWELENEAHARGFAVVCGVDEAGRGPLAGDVFAGACILPPDFDITGLDDSKKLSEKKRAALYDRIRAGALCATGRASPEEIDRLNILNAAMLAMRRAIDALPRKPDFALVDGYKLRGFEIPARCVVGGDGRSASIAAASVLAKVERDRYMIEMAETYPGYGFEQHKGYPTKAHYEALAALGPCAIHRRTFLKKTGGANGAAGAGNAPSPGRYGEDAAARYLEGLGWTILERNYRMRTGEIDIVARDGETVVFVEVKERRDAFFHSGMDAVDAAKIRHLREAADMWFAERHVQAPGRFDVVEIYAGEPKDSPFGPTYPAPKLLHTRQAF